MVDIGYKTYRVMYKCMLKTNTFLPISSTLDLNPEPRKPNYCIFMWIQMRNTTYLYSVNTEDTTNALHFLAACNRSNFELPLVHIKAVITQLGER
jgi:hypothetical protein